MAGVMPVAAAPATVAAMAARPIEVRESGKLNIGELLCAMGGGERAARLVAAPEVPGGPTEGASRREASGRLPGGFQRLQRSYQARTCGRSNAVETNYRFAAGRFVNA